MHLGQVLQYVTSFETENFFLALTDIVHIQIPPDRLHGSHNTQYRCGYYQVVVHLRVL